MIRDFDRPGIAFLSVRARLLFILVIELVLQNWGEDQKKIGGSGQETG